MKKVLSFFISLFAFLLIANQSLAVTYDLIAPSGTLTRGQNIKFTINIDTEGKSYSSTQIGMTYDTTVLQYVSASAGNTFTTISANPSSAGKLVISGSSNTGFTGTGTYAYVTFQLIATSAGSTQLCTLFNPDVATPTPVNNTPAPTALPTSGVAGNSLQIALGLAFVALAGAGFVVFRNL
ncbi:cohesin domain-containing protein [Patescibacteria group bacterium]|nr:cohesin domain-containing protein [Patescibacteria group bacterium]